uniref:DUF3730 domain-containing protein n=1 Tax=Periophthalmus magnuspinnatus TaxID=409849 RepID=A0A3B3ZW59_9GOBI
MAFALSLLCCRSSPHPYITALENREDCWAALLVEIDDFIRRAVDRNEPAYITMLVPFLRYLYCEPQRLSQQAHLRHNLLRVLLPVSPAVEFSENKDEQSNSSVSDSLLQCLCQLVVHMLFPPQRVGQVVLPLTSWFSELSVALWTLQTVASDPEAACDWLLSVSSALSSCLSLRSSFTLIVSYLLVSGQEEVCQLALNAVQSIASADPSQVPSLLPVLLFKLGREKRPELSNAVLNCLPNLGTHKVLRELDQSDLQHKRLRAVAMRLMTALWKKQDRVYPELQRLLSQQENRVVLGQDAQWEQLLSRAACLRDICIERPYQHGGDMLAAISLMLKQCTKPDLATPAALALQGLHELCRAEVVDIVSTWRTLGPELRADSRPLIVKATTELLALVPQLQVKSEAYEVLQK